ncbi:hypothetical protein [Pseudalkalibacillus berkeleyi]|uniref:Uncharacterized protein n=1 Tax=Pseudalkalibacillus berkeleyi TaxID=1069813 RepID=A0ABS9GUE0_9BACL|nr:hypothetical protein [Pseudalkalibacillus berkeleyi]MCF6136457.1 hypothetical protein [Pseudalkalibacillus berkeleyi]
MPNWVWVIYYTVLVVTFVAAIFSMTIKKHMIVFSFVVILNTITLPIAGLMNSMGRGKGMNELEFFIIQLQKGSFWSISIVIGYLFLLVWWVLFIKKHTSLEV